MGIVTAKTEGTCGKCKGRFDIGQKICVEKGKQPLCEKCAPKDARQFTPKAPLDPWNDFLGQAVVATAIRTKGREMNMKEFMKMAEQLANEMHAVSKNRKIA